MPKVVTIGNNKGGVGKTTLTGAIATLTAKAVRSDNLTVCAIDADPQGTLTRFFFDRSFRPEETSALIFDRKDQWDLLTTAPQIIHPTRLKNLSIIPAHIHLAIAEARYYEEPGRRFQKFIEKTLSEFDIVYIDAPPSLGRIMSNCLIASDYVLVPVQPELPSVEGWALFRNTLDAVRNINPSLKLMGLVINQIDDRVKDHKIYMETLYAMENKNILTTIHSAAAISSAWARGKWIQDTDNTERPYLELRELTLSVLDRMGYTYGHIG